MLQKITADKQCSVIHNEKGNLYRSHFVFKIVKTRRKLWARHVDRVESQKDHTHCVMAGFRRCK